MKKLHEASTALAGGKTIEDVCKTLGISPATYHRWQKAYGGADVATVREYEALTEETDPYGTFRSLFRDQFLNRNRFATEPNAKVLNADWIRNDTEARKPSMLRGQTSLGFGVHGRLLVRGTPLPTPDIMNPKPEQHLPWQLVQEMGACQAFPRQTRVRRRYACEALVFHANHHQSKSMRYGS